MNLDDFIHSFEFPDDALLNHRIPKKFLVEHGSPTAADKRQISEGIEDLIWRATLKPTTIGVATYVDERREVLEIAVVSMRLSPEGKFKRLTELVHRAIPYPVILITMQESKLFLTLAKKRWSEGQIGKTVIDGEIFEAQLDNSLGIDIFDQFRHGLSLSCQQHNSLHDLYQGWIDTALALQIARLKGTFLMPSSREHAVDRINSFRMCIVLAKTITDMRTAAAKEKQLSKQVELNLQIKRLQTQYDLISERL